MSPGAQHELMMACAAGEPGRIADALAAGAHAAQPTPHLGRTRLPLEVAVSAGHAAAAEALLAAGAPIDARALGGPTALEAACETGELACVQLLLRRAADPSTLDGDGASPLLHAAMRAHVECARALLAHGAAPSSPSGCPQPLHFALGCPALAELLLAQPVDVRVEDDEGCTALGAACVMGAEGAAAALLARGAAVEPEACGGAQPLALACAHGHLPLVRTLLAASASVHALDAHGEGPLHGACAGGHAEVAACLLRARADVGAASFENGRTPLRAACRGGHLDCARLLLAARADPDAGHPLLFACIHGRLGMVQLLCAHGASRAWGSVLLCGAEALTAERACARHGHDAALRWLRATRGWTPLHHLESLDGAAALALLRAGADVHARAHAAAPEGGGAEAAEEAAWSGVTPAQRAAELAARCPGGEADEGSAACLVRRAAQPWAPSTHALWPDAQRARALPLLLCGHALARDSGGPACGAVFAGCARALLDLWLAEVMPRVLEAERATDAAAARQRAAAAQPGQPRGRAAGAERRSGHLALSAGVAREEGGTDDEEGEEDEDDEDGEDGEVVLGGPRSSALVAAAASEGRMRRSHESQSQPQSQHSVSHSTD